MYDEVGVEEGVGLNGDGVFTHYILLSDGRTLEIPFVSVAKHSVPLSVEDAEGQQDREAGSAPNRDGR